MLNFSWTHQMTATGITGSRWFALRRSRTHKECRAGGIALQDYRIQLQCLNAWRLVSQAQSGDSSPTLVPSMFKKDKLVWGVGCVLSGMSFSQNGFLAGWFFFGSLALRVFCSLMFVPSESVPAHGDDCDGVVMKWRGTENHRKSEARFN